MIKRLALIAGLAFIFWGCDKSPEAGLGAPTTADEVNNAQGAALAKIDPTQAQKGQFVYFLQTQELHSSQEPIENLVGEEAVTITEREEFGSFFEITVVKETVSHVEDEKPHYKFKNVYSIGYDEAPTTSALKSVKATLLEQMATPLKKMSENSSSISFYNLKTRTDKVNPPKKVLEHTPCPEKKDCRINVTTVSYDAYVTSDTQEPQKYQFETWISTDVPYFATILKSCITTLVAVDTARPLIRQCSSVYDYKFQEDVTAP